jgi:hypothetical protein
MNFLRNLGGISSLTPRQLEALTIYVRVASGELTLKQAAQMAGEGRMKGPRDKPLAIGSYYRTVSQARSNIKASLRTVVISLWLGLVRIEDLRKLFEAVGVGSRHLSDEEAQRFLQVLEALLGRIIV